MQAPPSFPPTRADRQQGAARSRCEGTFKQPSLGSCLADITALCARGWPVPWPVDPPSKPWPAWYEHLCAGDFYRFDVCLAASSVPKQAARWLWLLLLLGGDIERNPGPPPVPRGPLDLSSGFVATTRHKMRKSLDAFAHWLREELGLSLSSVTAAATALRAFGLHLYAAGLPRYLLVYAITSVQDACPEYRNHLTPAWQIDKKWQHAEPGECRPVISKPILQAAVSLGLLWCWGDWVAVTYIGFICVLRPAEFITLSAET